MTLDELAVELRLNGDDFLSGLASSLSAWESFSGALLKTGAALSAMVTAPLLGVAKAAMSMGTQLQQAEISFQTMLGSAELAGAFLNELKDFAARTPFEFSELVPAAKRMMALGFAAEEVIPMLRSLGNAAAGLGGSAELIQRLVLALGQMRAKGKVSAEEMRQLAEAGIPAWEMLAKSMGKTTAEVMKLSEKGQIAASQAIPAIVAGMQEKFGGLMEGFMQTAMGQFSNLKDQLGFVLADIGKNLLPLAAMVIEKFAMPAAEALRNLADWFNKLNESTKLTIIGFAGLAAATGPVLAAWGGMIKMYGPMIEGGIRLAATLSGAFNNIAYAIQNNMVGALIGLEANILRFVGIAVPAMAALGAAFILWQIPELQTAVKGLGGQLKQFWSDTLSPLVDSFLELAGALIKAGADLVSSGLAEALGVLKEALHSESVREFGQALGELSSSVKDLWEALGPLREVLGPVVELLFKWLAVSVGGQITMAFEALKLAIQTSTAILNALIGVVQTELSAVMKAATAWVGSLASGFRVVGEAINSVSTWILKFSDLLKTEFPLLAVFAATVGATYDSLKAKVEDWVKSATAGHKAVATVGSSALDQLTAAFKAAEEAQTNAQKALVEFDKTTGKSLGTQQQLTDATLKVQAAKAALVAQMEKEGLGVKTLYDRYAQLIREYVQAQASEEALKKTKGDSAEAAAAYSAAVSKTAALHAEGIKAQIALTQSAARLGLTLADVKKQFEVVGPAIKNVADLQKELVTAVKEADMAVKDSIRGYQAAVTAEKALQESGAATKSQLESAARATEVAFNKMDAASRKLEAANRALHPEKIAELYAKAEAEVEQHNKKLLDSTDRYIKEMAQLNEKDKDLQQDLVVAARKTAKELEDAYRSIQEAATKQVIVDPLGAAKQQWSAMVKNLHAVWQEYIRGEATVEQYQEAIDAVNEAHRVYQQMLQNTKLGISTLTTAQAGAVQSTLDLANAFKIAGIETAKDMENQLQRLTWAYEKIKEARKAGGANAPNLAQQYQAELAMINETIRQLERLGKTITDQDKVRLDSARKRRDELEKILQTELSFWYKFSKELKQIWETMKVDIGRGLWATLLGRDRREFNKNLNEQAADLQASLADRTKDWEEYQKEVATKWEQAQQDYAKKLAEDEKALLDSLAEREQDYAKAEAETADKIAAVRTEYATRLADELADLQSNLDEKRADYEDYVTDITQKMADVRQAHADSLADQLSDLQNALDEKRASYEDYVRDVRKTLGRIYEDYNEDLDDETKSVAENVSDRQREYTRDEEDLLERIARLKKAGKTEQDEEVQDLRKSLRRKKEDLDEYLKDQNDKLEEFRSDAKRKLDREVADLQENLAQRTSEWEKYQKENQAKRDEYITKNQQDLEKELGSLQKSLNDRTQEWNKYQADTAKKAEDLEIKYAAALAKEEGDLLTSLQKKKDALDTYRGEVAAKLDQLRVDYAAKLADEEGDLLTSLAKRQKDYDDYVAEISKKLEDLKEKHRTIWDDIGGFMVGAFERAGEALTVFVTTYLLGQLFKWLKNLIDDILPSVAKGFAGAFSFAGGGMTGGVASAIGGVTSAVSSGIGSAVSGVVSAASGWIGAASSAIGAAITAIGQARMEGTLNAIEKEARYAQIHLYYILSGVNEYLPKLADIWWYFWNRQDPWLKSINDYADKSEAHLGWIEGGIKDVAAAIKDLQERGILTTSNPATSGGTNNPIVSSLRQLEDKVAGAKRDLSETETRRPLAELLYELNGIAQQIESGGMTAGLAIQLSGLVSQIHETGKLTEDQTELLDRSLAALIIGDKNGLQLLQEFVGEMYKLGYNLEAVLAEITRLNALISSAQIGQGTSVSSTAVPAPPAASKTDSSNKPSVPAYLAYMLSAQQAALDKAVAMNSVSEKELVDAIAKIDAAGRAINDPERMKLDALLAFKRNTGPEYQAWLRGQINRTTGAIETSQEVDQLKKDTTAIGAIAQELLRPLTLLGTGFNGLALAVQAATNVLNSMSYNPLANPFPTTVNALPWSPVGGLVAGGTVPVVIKEARFVSEINGREVGNALLENLTLQGVRL